MLRTVLLLIITSLLFGCGVKVVPRQVAGGIVDMNRGSQTLSSHKLKVSVQMQDQHYAPYRQVDNIASFFVDVQNNTSSSWSFPFELVRLVDNAGHQYSLISPQRVKEIVSRDLPYMVPYPYVGYYYLEDAQRGSHFNTFTSNLPYYAANNPQDIFTQALPEVAVGAGNRISGLVYLLVDPTTMDSFEFKVPLPPSENHPGGELVFPFNVEK